MRKSSKPSLGTVLVSLGNPSAAQDAQMLGLGPAASLDEVCYALAATGLYREETLRVNALRALAVKVEDDFVRPEPTLKWLDRLHERLGAWSAASIARAVLPLASGDKSALAAIEAAEAWVAGVGTAAKARLASVAAYQAGSRLYSAGSEYRRPPLSEGEQDRLFVAGNAVLTASHAASMISGGTAGSIGLTVETALMALRVDSDVDSTDDERLIERDLLTAITERLVAFPVWQGPSEDDLWPMQRGARLT